MEKKKGNIKNGAEREELHEKWYYRPWVIFLAIIGFGPLGLIPLWFRPRTKLRLKMLISIIVLIATVWMTVESVKFYRMMLDHYEELAEAMKNI